MTGSLLNDLQPIDRNEFETGGSAEEPLREPPPERGRSDNLVASLSVAERIVRRKGIAFWQAEAADVVQAIALRLVKWRDRYREKSASMTTADWQSFTARTAYNEVNRHFSGEKSRKDLPIEAATEVFAPETPEGESLAEVFSLVRRLWQEICSLSVRQRRALLLHNDESVMYFLEVGITDEELADVLEMSVEDWIKTSERIPLTDAEIAELPAPPAAAAAGGKSKYKSPEAQARSVKKARHEARAKLQKITRR